MDAKNTTLLIDKPAGWTSFDVVAKLRSALRAHYTATGVKPTKRQLRVGHGGTLDPFATGLLIVLVGEACKNAGQYLKLDKTYEFTARLGEHSTTGDTEGEIEPVSNTIPTEKALREALEAFTGQIMQQPPAYSAVKVNGQRAYALARAGKAVEIPKRPVTINKLELLSYDYPYVLCRCDVGSGTYIRTLVEDIGSRLGTGAYCSELRRTRIGAYRVDDAKEPEAQAKTLI